MQKLTLVFSVLMIQTNKLKLMLYFLLAVAQPYPTPTLTLSFICIDAHEMSLLEEVDICDAFNL